MKCKSEWLPQTDFHSLLAMEAAQPKVLAKTNTENPIK